MHVRQTQHAEQHPQRAQQHEGPAPAEAGGAAVAPVADQPDSPARLRTSEIVNFESVKSFRKSGIVPA
jgi:hypothetical protein